MYICLQRNQPKGNVLTGRLLIDDAFACDTLEHWQYAIPAGFYRVRLTYSPRFQEILPILDHVYGFARESHNGTLRTGIRIHAGNTIKDTTGCILVGKADRPSLIASSPNRLSPTRLLSSRKCLSELREYLLNNQKSNPNEEIYIEITQPDPYPLADEPCPLELQQYEIDARRAEQRYLDALEAGLLRSGKS